MLTLWRRHTKKCPHSAKGRAYIKCACPVWVDGEVDGRRIRESCGTRDWARAGRIAGTIEDQAAAGRGRRRVSDAFAGFIAQCEVEESTRRRYRGTMKALLQYAESIGAA